MSVKLNITACDNEMLIYASNNSKSYRLVEIVSGNYNAVNAEVTIDAGEYLSPAISIGINGPIGSKDKTSDQTVYLTAGTYYLYAYASDWGTQREFNASYTDQNGTTTQLIDVNKETTGSNEVTTFAVPNTEEKTLKVFKIQLQG